MTETAIVAGVGPGLGLAVARRFAREGLTVAMLGRDGDRLAEMAGGAEGGSGRLVPVTCDVTDPAQVAAAFKTVDGLGTLRVAVYNAGPFEFFSAVDVDPAVFEACWKIGCFGGLLVGQAAAKRMLDAGRGTILFTGATASQRAGGKFVSLAAPKFGLRAVAQSMARDLFPQNIHVAHAVLDGLLTGPRHGHLADKKGPDGLLDADQVAEVYWQVHCQPRAVWMHEFDLRPWVESF